MFRINPLSAALIALLCVSSSALAATPAASDHYHDIPRYRLVDVGSFGGTFGLFSNPGGKVLNRHGTAVGLNSTSAPDPFDPNCFFDCQVDRAFVRNHGVTTDLGALSNGVSSFPYGINDHGLIVGVSQNGAIDPLTGYPQTRGVVWRNGQIINLGTLGGSQSAANAINRYGQIVGAALTTRPDPFANVAQAACRWLPTIGPDCAAFDFAFNALFAPAATRTHAVLWINGAIHDLGTLGGPDSTAAYINDRGQVAGWSYTSYKAGPSGVPAMHPFVWENGRMTDLGSLGGTIGAPSFLNERGQVVGVSNLAGDLILHPFLWSRAAGMHDLGTLGGTYAHPDWLNEAGNVVGYSTTADHLGRAFYWHRGHMTNLGTLGTDEASEAFSINNHGLIVGQTFVRGGDDLNGFLSDNGGPLINLNSLVRAGSKLHVIAAVAINDRGEIAGSGRLPNGDIHPIVLIPLDEDAEDPGDESE